MKVENIYFCLLDVFFLNLNSTLFYVQILSAQSGQKRGRFFFRGHSVLTESQEPHVSVPKISHLYLILYMWVF